MWEGVIKNTDELLDQPDNSLYRGEKVYFNYENTILAYDYTH